MAGLVLRHNLETRADGESEQRHERIVEANAIHVEGAGSDDEVPRDLVAAEQRVEHRRFDVGRRPDSRRRPLAAPTGVGAT